MRSEAIPIAKRSYERCCAAPDFITSFYRNFFTACPEAEAMFAQTDFDRQARLLRHAIGLLFIFPDQVSNEPTILSRLAEKHSRRELNVDPEWYPLFGDSLILTASQHDPEFSPAVAAAWREAVAPGIEYMKAKH